MNKNLTWKQTLLVSFICYAIKFLFQAWLGTAILAIIEIVGLITLILGIVGAIGAGIRKMQNKK